MSFHIGGDALWAAFGKTAGNVIFGFFFLQNHIKSLSQEPYKRVVHSLRIIYQPINIDVYWIFRLDELLLDLLAFFSQNSVHSAAA